METLTASVQAWRSGGRSLTIGGLEVFVRDEGAAVAGETVLLLHGFPTSSYDWRHVVPALAERRRVVLLDFPGFGLSEKPLDYSYSLHEQADIVALAMRALSVSRAHIVAHDMGTSVACELMARRLRGLLPFEARSLVLMNGSVHIELARLTPSQKLLRSPLGGLFARVGSARLFKMQMKRVLGRPIAEAELDDMWSQLTYRGGKALLSRTISYIDERHRFWHRWIGALRQLDRPALVLWGPADPVAVFAIAEALANEIPAASLERLEGLGHYPQLENPALTAAALLRFFETVAPVTMA